MFSPRRFRAKSQRRHVNNQNRLKRSHYRERAKSRRALASRDIDNAFVPTEDWYEPTDKPGYRIVVQEAGKDYRHVVTPQQIRARLAKLPQEFLKELEVIQLSCMTRKKNYFPCYGLQWGNAIYLYPFEETLDEYFYQPPPRSLVVESKMFGGRWEQYEAGVWRLIWTEASARDFQLNNVLIHELGHLIDYRNSSYTDQERYAEWFAIEYGYRQTGGGKKRRPRGKIRRRHHGS